MALQASFTYRAQFLPEMEPQVRFWLAKVAAKVETEAKRLSPVLTGNLRRSIESEVKGAGKTLHGLVTATAHYSAFVELGTRYQNPQPFLRPALAKVLKNAS